MDDDCFMFQNVPPDLSQCVFVIEQALSVRALQEIISSNDAEAVRETLQFDYQADIFISL